jgi:Sec-independent protein translocase protein TatA
VSELMGDVAKGIKSFKKNISSVEDSDNKNLSDKNNKNSES